MPDQFTIARVAAVLGRDVREIRRSLAGREPDGSCVVSGNVTRTYLVASLPESLRLDLVSLAASRGYDSPERLLAREDARWEPPIAIREIHPEEINRAQKRCAALANNVRDLSGGLATVAEITGRAADAHLKIVGYAVTAGTVDNIMRRAIARDGGRGEFHRWELYLPEAPKRLQPLTTRRGDDFAPFEIHLVGVDVSRPTLDQRGFAWTGMCDNLQMLLERGDNPRAARSALIRHVFAKAPWLCRSRQSLAKCFDEKWARYCAGERFLGDRRPQKSGNHQPLPLNEEDKHKLIARALTTGGVARAWRKSLEKADLSAPVIQRYVTNPASKSYVPRRVRELLGPKVEMLDDIHHGPRQAKLGGAYVTRDWSGVFPGDWYQGDDCTLPLYYWEIGPDGRPHAIRGQFLAMIDCSSVRALAFALHSERNYNARVIRGVILRTHDSYGLPRRGFYFEQGIWKSSKILTGAGDEVAGEDTEKGLRDFGIEFKHAKLPRSKLIERVLGSLQTEMEDQPGYCGRDEKTERFERLQRKLQLARTGHLEYSSFLLHRDEWKSRLTEICDAYNCERQDGRLKGLSPREAWETRFEFAKPLVKLADGGRYLLANHRRPLLVTANGICVQIGKERHWYRNHTTGFLRGQKVQVYFNPEQLESIWIQRALDDPEAIVVPRAPTPAAMDATREDLAAALSSCDAHNQAARTIYAEIKSHFPQNGPSPFRQNVVDPGFASKSHEIVQEQERIAAARAQQHEQKTKITRYRRKLGSLPGSNAVSDERKLRAYQLLEEANRDANTSSES